MEDTLQNIDKSMNTPKLKSQIDIIKRASEVAQHKIDYESAHDEGVLLSIEIVEEFLKKKHRLCYGGQAINAHLPKKYKIYDPDLSIPDYDFFTPDQDNDVDQIVRMLREEGFREIAVRDGMHEGTLKIYVDYIPVADITSIEPKIYRALFKRSFKSEEGISYLDANTLRMLMYLELSRPKGEVERWTKVYERLALFNEFVSHKGVDCVSKSPFKSRLFPSQILATINYVVEKKYIFAGADLIPFYDTAVKSQKIQVEWVIRSNKPIIFFTPEPDTDAAWLTERFAELDREARESQKGPKERPKGRPKKFRVKTYKSSGLDIIPSMNIVVQGKHALVFLIHTSACHSFLNIPFKDSAIYTGQMLRVASMDTLITLYFSMGFIKTKFFDMNFISCLANQLVHLNIMRRDKGEDHRLPFITIKCAGHQTSLPSLIRAKVKRITEKKRVITKRYRTLRR